MGVCFQKPAEKIICHRLEPNPFHNNNNNNNSNNKSRSNNGNIKDKQTSSSNNHNKEHNEDRQDEMINDRFVDFPEWEGERYKGFGIKRMKGYKCSLNIDDLNALREDFWTSKIINNPSIWKTIRQACIYDHSTCSRYVTLSLGKCEEFLIKHHIAPLDSCVNALQDEMQNVYLIPNFCINDPYFEKEILTPDQTVNKEITSLKLRLYNLYTNDTQVFQVPSNTTGESLKKMYMENNRIDMEKNRIKLIFAGAFIEDSQMLCQHQVKNDFIIQVIISAIE